MSPIGRLLPPFLGPLFAAEQRRPAREFGRALGELHKRQPDRGKFAPDEFAGVEPVREFRSRPALANRYEVAR
jgi:hypothetical protein